LRRSSAAVAPVSLYRLFVWDCWQHAVLAAKSLTPWKRVFQQNTLSCRSRSAAFGCSA